MPRISKRAIFIRELGDVVVSHHVFADAHKLLCEDLDSEFDDDEILNTKAIAAIQYTAVQNFRYLYRATSYHADIRGRRSSYAMPEWKKIVLGYKYNEEEFLRIFRIPRRLFLSFVQILRNHPAFGKNGKKQRKHFSAELHLLVLLKYMGAEGNGKARALLQII